MSEKREVKKVAEVEQSISTAGIIAESPGGKPEKVKEVGGRDGPEPTRFGDWEKNGRCIDF
jgi:hypothetical protein